ncbi:MAG TPA: RNA polymerase sigma factor [Candidatus Paceibacterota bacterium]|nr:RNA polymerase sigma factor [Candidatus Paceibacterota bacterium]
MLGYTATDSGRDLSDEDVLRRSQAQPWLFQILVERYQDAFLRKAKTIVFNELDAEEIVQDAFTKIYINAHRYQPQPGAQFSSWAYRILMNTAFTRYQKLVKEGQRFAQLDPEFEQYIGERADHTGFAERHDAIERLLAKLPGHFAHVLRLHYLERWSHHDIAVETGENTGTIKARIHRAKAAFRKEAQGRESELLSDIDT